MRSTTGARTPKHHKRIEKLLEREYELFRERHPQSRLAHIASKKVLPLGVGSSFQYFDPYPVTVDHADGPWAWDVDGHRFLDLNMGFGALLVGHNHPAVTAAVSARLFTGTLFVAPSELGTKAATLLSERFGHPLWRFCNSGTEATMSAVRIARAFTGRAKILKLEGGYHGHSDTLLVSGKPPVGCAGSDGTVPPVADSLGVPSGVLADTLVVPFNDFEALTAVFVAHGHEIAGFILEPAMENAGIILPRGGYLDLARALCTEYGALLIFDEVKTGLTAGYSGAAGLWGVTPDLTCLAKSIGGGLPVGAFGGRHDAMSVLERGCVHQGTYNANPLCMAAVIAVLQAASHSELQRTHEINQHFAAGVDKLLDSVRDIVPTCVQTLGSKGSVTFSAAQPTSYADWKNSDLLAAELFWLHSTNRGVLTPPGLDEQWLVSLAHTRSSMDVYLEQLDELCRALRGS